MSSLWVVFRMDQQTGLVDTIGEFHAISSQAAIHDAVSRHGARYWWDYWVVPSEWYRTECLDKLLEESKLH